MDADGSGTIDFDELNRMLRRDTGQLQLEEQIASATTVSAAKTTGQQQRNRRAGQVQRAKGQAHGQGFSKTNVALRPSSSAPALRTPQSSLGARMVFQQKMHSRASASTLEVIRSGAVAKGSLPPMLPRPGTAPAGRGGIHGR